MKTKRDAEIRETVLAEMEWDPAVGSDEIHVDVHDGIVTLSGAVTGYAEKHAAERAVFRTDGVQALVEELSVLLPSPAERQSDTALAAFVLDVIRRRALPPEERVRVKVEDGWVTLQGEVDSPPRWAAAAEEVRARSGVQGVHFLVHRKGTGAEPTRDDLEVFG